MRASPHWLDALSLRVETRLDASLPFPATATESQVFERIWAMLPEGRGVNRVGSGPGGCFLKGQALPLSWALRHWFRPPGIPREVEALTRLRGAGIRVPRVLGFGMLRRWGLLRRSLLLLEHISDAEDLAQCLGRRSSDEERLRVFEAVGRAVARMHAVSFHHRNLSARNLLVRDGVSGPEVLVIDCPRAEWARFAPRTAFLRRDDRLRLVRSALRCGASDAEVRRLLEALGADEVERIVELARDSIRRRRSRPLRARAWLILGV